MGTSELSGADTGNCGGGSPVEKRPYPKEVSVISRPLDDLTESEARELSDFLDRCPVATPFHSLEWNSVLATEFGLKPWVSTARGTDGIVGYNVFCALPQPFGLKTVWSPPRAYEAVYGGPACLAGFEEIASLLLAEQDRVGSGHTSYVIVPPGFDARILREFGYRLYEAKTVLLDLSTDADQMWQTIGSKRRNDIRRAEKAGVQTREGELSDVSVYYDMLSQTFCRSRTNPLEQSFFSRLIETMVPVRKASFLIATVDNLPVAGTIILYSGDTAIYWSGASFEEGRKCAANVLLQWRAMHDAAKQGLRQYDFLGIDPRLPGISAFKEGFGGRVVSYHSGVKRTSLGQLIRAASGLKRPGRLFRKILRSGLIEQVEQES